MEFPGANFILDSSKGKAIDVYEGWVVVRLNKYWYRAHIAPGFVSLVDFVEPNAHTRLIRKDDLDKVRHGDVVDALPFEGSPYVLLSTPAHDISDLDLAIVRYGRVATIGNKPFWIVDGIGRDAVIVRGILADESADLPQIS